MIDTPAFLDSHRPDVPDLVVPRGVTPFYLEGRPVRGRFVRLGQLTDVLLSRHDNPVCVSKVAGEALALVAGLASSLKFQGTFSVQIKGDGPLSMLLADCTDAGALRFYARSDSETIEELSQKQASELFGDGYMAFTVDQGSDMDRHQGIVEIVPGDLADMAMHYFATSEQHACWVRLACEQTESGWRAAALILERIAQGGGSEAEFVLNHEEAEDEWTTAVTLASTIKNHELLDDTLLPEALIHRLFHAQSPQYDRPRAVAYGCRCSRARLSTVLEGFSADDLDHMASEGEIVMTCEFCNFDFRFSRQDVGRNAG